MRWHYVLVPLMLVAVCRAYPKETGPSSDLPADLTQLSLEELMKVQVTSVSRRAEPLQRAPAAIHVLTQEDIQRSGATSIPEALRLVPGINVARVDSHQWSVTARGFSGVFANKLLVLQDGRSLYTPLFSGVFWEAQDYLLEDLDRIEVVRGPGAVLWGANAVNGVISIVTKSSKDTQGMLLSTGGGTEEQGFAGLRYGGKLSDDAWYRVYGKYSHRDDGAMPDGSRNMDALDQSRGGFRIDWEPSDVSKVMFSGDIFGDTADQLFKPTTTTGGLATVPGKFKLNGGNLLAKWTRSFAEDNELEIQSYYDTYDWNTEIAKESRHTGDIQLKHTFKPFDRHEISWGLGYRVSGDYLGNTFTVSHNPDSRIQNLFSGFVHDKITLQEDHWWLWLGTHLEHNDFSGAEVQPSARLLWSPNERSSYWASVSRAVRTPSQSGSDVTLNQPGPLPGTIARIMGNPDQVSEKMISYQIGTQLQLHPRFSLSATLFYNDYDDLRSAEVTSITPGVPTVFNALVGNGLYGESYGIELAPRWQVTDYWRLQAAYSLLQIQLHNKPGSTDTLDIAAEGQSPDHQFSLLSTLDLPHNIQFDSTLRYVDSLPALNIGSYVQLDLRLAWRPKPNLELAIVGQNLLDNHHPEYSTYFVRTVVSELERGVYAKLTWRF